METISVGLTDHFKPISNIRTETYFIVDQHLKSEGLKRRLMT